MMHTGEISTGGRPMTPEKLALLVDMLPAVGSLRDAAAALDVRLETVRRAAAPFLAIMKLNGTHPQCGCGRDRFHPYGCVDSHAKGWPADCAPGHTREQTSALLVTREIAIAMLLTGMPFREVEVALGKAKGTARKYLRFLTADQLAERERAIAERKSA